MVGGFLTTEPPENSCSRNSDSKSEESVVSYKILFAAILYIPSTVQFSKKPEICFQSLKCIERKQHEHHRSKEVKLLRGIQEGGCDEEGL